MAKRPLILVTNDDGVKAPGLRFLLDCIKGLGEIVAVAPQTVQSGKSNAFSGGRPLRYELDHHHGDIPVYWVDGTPTDCVKLSMHVILGGRRPDFVLSGVNHGSNAGNCVIYSGTMGAAMEACMLGIPAVGYSLTHHSWEADFKPTAPYVREITEKVIAEGLPKNICLNVNFPALCAIEGLKVVRAALGYWTDEFEDYRDPSGKPFYWLTGRFHNLEPDDPSTDEYWLARHWATVVPVRPDQTAADKIPDIERLLL